MDLPKNIETALVGGVGAFIRAMPAQELPARLRRFQGFRPQSLLRHQDALLGLLEDDELRAKLLDWLNEMKPSLPKADLEVLELAARREEGWAEALGARATATRPPVKKDPTERLAAELEREKGKARRARDDLKRVREEAAKERDTQAALVAALKRDLAEAKQAIHEAHIAGAAARRAEESAKLDADRRVRKAARGLEKAQADVARARTELKDLRRRLSTATKERGRLETRAAALEARLDRIKKSPAPAVPPRARGKRRIPLPVPKGRLRSDPQTLDEWLSASEVRLLIDGYNVTMAEGGFGDLRLEVQRERLVTELASLASMKEVPTTVVFDGKEVDRHPARKKKGLVRVHYSRDEIADDHLVDLVQRSPSSPVVVVTSDRELTERVERLGANVANSPQLLSLLR